MITIGTKIIIFFTFILAIFNTLVFIYWVWHFQYGHNIEFQWWSEHDWDTHKEKPVGIMVWFMHGNCGDGKIIHLPIWLCKLLHKWGEE